MFLSPYGVDYYRGFVDQTGGVAVELREAPLDVSLRDTNDGVRTALWVGASVAGLTALVAGAFAWDARRDFSATSLQAPARDAAHRYHLASGVAIAGAALAAGAGALGWLVFPTASQVGANGGHTSLGVALEVVFSW